MTLPRDNQIRLAMVSDSVYPYNKGGKEVRIYELSTRLAARGYQVDIYTMKWWDTPELSVVHEGVTYHAISKLYPLYAGERRSIKEGIFFGVACLRLLNVRFDVIDVDHMPYFPLYSVKLVAWLKRKPMTATWHEVWGKDYWLTYLGAAGRVAYLIEKLSVLLPNKIIGVSDLTVGRLETEMKAPARLFTVNNGIDLAKIRQISASKRTSDVIYVGRLLEHKHVDVLLRAMVQVKKTRPDVKCFIVGDGPERTRLEALSRRLGLDGSVEFTGFLPRHHQVFSYMKASKVFVLPSTREGFGISVLEANACGLPVVTINDAANAARDLIDHTNGLVTPLSPRAIARAVDTLIDEPLNRRSVTATARAYDWNNAAQSLDQVYAS